MHNFRCMDSPLRSRLSEMDLQNLNNGQVFSSLWAVPSVCPPRCGPVWRRARHSSRPGAPLSFPGSSPWPAGVPSLGAAAPEISQQTSVLFLTKLATHQVVSFLNLHFLEWEPEFVPHVLLKPARDFLDPSVFTVVTQMPETRDTVSNNISVLLWASPADTRVCTCACTLWHQATSVQLNLLRFESHVLILSIAKKSLMWTTKRLSRLLFISNGTTAPSVGHILSCDGYFGEAQRTCEAT